MTAEEEEGRLNVKRETDVRMEGMEALAGHKRQTKGITVIIIDVIIAIIGQGSKPS